MIVRSNVLYSVLGGTKAFNAVHAQFVTLQGIITSRKGGLVKIIVYAVMAAFPHSEAALQAAVGFRNGFDRMK